MFGVGAGDRAGDLIADEEIDARLTGVVAAADEEVDPFALDAELGRGQGAGGGVASEVAVDQALAEKAADAHLVRQGAPSGAVPERLARGGPVAVGRALEIGENEVGAVVGPAERDDEGEGRQDREEGSHRFRAGSRVVGAWSSAS